MPFQFSSSNDVDRAADGGVLFVTIDRAEKRNALSLGVLDAMRRIFVEAANDSNIRVGVVTGAGSKAFASGGDLAELSAYRSREDAEALSHHGKAALDSIRHFPVSVIARLNGLAFGGGAELALACDLRFAAADSKFGFIHGRLCISPSWGGSEDLIRIVGPAKALELMATAAVLDAEEGRAAGIFHQVCPKDVPFDAWFDERLALFRDQPRHVMSAYKSITASSGARSSEAARLETRHFCELWCHDDHWKAAAQFKGSGQ